MDWFTYLCSRMLSAKTRLNNQKVNFARFCRQPVTFAQEICATEEYPDAGILLDYKEVKFTPAWS